MPATSGGPAWAINPPAPTGGAFVSGCANAAARSPASGAHSGVRSSTSQQHDASKSAGADGAARLNHASSTALDRGDYASEHDSRQFTTCRRCGAETFTRPGPLW